MNATEAAHPMTKDEITKQLADVYGITMDADFVPFSQSRNAKATTAMGHKVWRSLNWKVTLKHSGRAFILTDYSAGEGHAPASKKIKGRATSDQRDAINWELENGYEAKTGSYTGHFMKGKKLLPDLADVLYSFVVDYNVLDYATYEDWAGDLGYSPDSREGEKIYRLCIEHALKFRAAFGESGMAELQNLFQDY